MNLAQAFNRSAVSRFLNSSAGRAFRLLTGTGLVIIGYLLRDHPLGMVSIVWGVLGMTAGGLDVCYISLVLGGPFSGTRIRDCQLS